MTELTGGNIQRYANQDGIRLIRNSSEPTEIGWDATHDVLWDKDGYIHLRTNDADLPYIPATGAAPADATYWVTTSYGAPLSNEVVLSGFTGVLYVTAGVPSALTTTGSGTVAVLATSPTIVTPTIASFVNSNHNHQNFAGGGQLNASSVFSAGTMPAIRGGTGSDLSATGGSNQFVRQSSFGAGFSVSVIATADIATALTTPGPIGETTPNTGKFQRITISNADGTGYLELTEQSGPPATPTNAIRMFADASNRFSWKGENGYVRTFDGTANTADRVYVLPDAAGTMALTSNLSAYLPLAGGTISGNLSVTGWINLTSTSVTQTGPNALKTPISVSYSPTDFSVGFSGLDTFINPVGTGSSITTTMRGLNFVVKVDGSGGGTSGPVGLIGEVQINQTSGTWSAATGASFAVRNLNAGVITTANGLRHIFIVSGTGNIVTANDFDVRSPSVTSSGAIIAHRGVYIENLGHVLTTTSEGIHIDSQSGSTNNTHLTIGSVATGNWAIYSSVASSSHFGAAVEIVGSADVVQQTVAGNSTQTADLVQWNNSGGTVQLAIGPSTVASGASAVWRRFYVAAQTVTVTGNTNITTASGFNLVEFGIPTITSSSAVTISNAATVTIVGAPAAAGSITITSARAFWVQAGTSLFAGAITVTASLQSALTGVTTTSTDGLILLNNANASAGNPVRISPRVRWQGAAWNTSGGGSTKSHAFKAELITVSANPSTSYLDFGHDPELTGTYVDTLQLSSVFGLKLPTLGQGIYLKEGANGTMGVATLVAGTVVVATTKASATCRIILTDAGGGTLANVGGLSYVLNAGVGFTINSANPLDNNNVNWIIFDQA